MPAKVKPSKPYEGFPLYAHASGRWAKRIRGTIYYFGPWRDHKAALDKYLDQRDDLQAGRKPRPKGGVIVRDIVNDFLNTKRALMENGELSPRTHDSYRRTCVIVSEAFGPTRLASDLTPQDFEKLRETLSATRKAVALSNEIRHVRMLFKYAFEAGHIPQPVRFGPSFKSPSRRTLRKERQERGPRMFTADEIRHILRAAKPQLKAMILLGLNCGYGQSDCARLPRSAVNLETGWIHFPRPKTLIDRRAPLWPETIAAIRAVIEAKKARKPARAEYADLVFLTKYGEPWVRALEPRTEGKESVTQVDSVSLELGKILRELEIKRPGIGFYALRHGLETIGGEVKDQPALDHIMGHADHSMAAVYREGIGEDRLRAVVNHVRTWLFPPKVKKRGAK